MARHFTLQDQDVQDRFSDITKNAQFDELSLYKKCTNIRSYVPKPVLNIDKVKEAAELINAKNHLLYLDRIILGQAGRIKSIC
jgi:acetolactate synthase-1/2/3 large subunit